MGAIFAAISLFFKEKVAKNLFSEAGAFIGVLIGLLLIVVLFNSDTILSRFGFQTKTNLATQLSQAQAATSAFKTANEALVKQVADLQKQAAIDKQNLSDYYQQKEKDRQTIEKLKHEKAKKEQVLNTQIDMKTKIDPKADTITLPLSEMNEHSVIEINALNEAYDELF